MLPSHPLSRTEALAKLERMSRAVQSLVTAVTIEATMGGLISPNVIDYPPLPGTLLFQKPNSIRIQAKYLTFGAFDMTSDGETYQAYVPNEKKLFVGQEMGPPVGAIFPEARYNLLAELRPRQIKSALLLDIVPYVENTQIGSLVATLPMPKDRRRYFVVDFFDSASGTPRLIEKVWIDLSTPAQEISRRQIFTGDGQIDSDIMFSEWKAVSGSVSLPEVVNITFPEKDLSLKLTLDFDGIEVNDTIPAENFELPPHPNATIIRLTPKQATNLQ
jgi:hypothetical protein